MKWPEERNVLRANDFRPGTYSAILVDCTYGLSTTTTTTTTTPLIYNVQRGGEPKVRPCGWKKKLILTQKLFFLG